MQKITLLFILFFVSIHVQTLFAHENWSKFRGDLQNSGQAKIDVKELPQIFGNRSPMSFPTNGLVWGSPVIDSKGNIFVGSSDKNFYAFTPKGEELWRYTLLDKSDSLIDSAAAFTANEKLIVVPGGDGSLHALDHETGELIWRFDAHHASDELHTSGEVVNSFEGNVTYHPSTNLIYAGSDNGFFYGIDADTGKEKFSYQTNMMIWSVPAFSNKPNENWLAFGSLDGHLHLIDKETGNFLTKYKIGGEIKASPAFIPQENLFVIGSSSGTFMGLSLTESNGLYEIKKAWSFQAEGEIYGSAAYKNGVIILSDTKGYLYGLNYQGKHLWTYQSYKGILSSPAITNDDVILFGGSNGHLYALNLHSGRRIWSYQTSPAGIKNNLDSSVAISPDGMIYVGSYDGNVYGVPYEFCSSHLKDERCEFLGSVHQYPFLKKLNTQKSYLLMQDFEGNFHQELRNVKTTEIVRLRFVIHKNERHQNLAAINPFGLKIEISPEVDFDYRISGDGKDLNIINNNYWEENTCYKIKVNGSYYHKKHWFYDKFKWLFLPKFSTYTKFCTGNNKTDEDEFLKNAHLPFNIHSLFLYGPTSLDTYIPAALDGQKFVGTFFDIDKTNKTFKIMLWPSHVTQQGFKVYPEPLRTAVFEGDYHKNAIRLKTKDVVMGSMGAIIPFQSAIYVGTINEAKVSDGLSFMETSCLKIKGNGSNYTFPMDFVDRTCDHLLRIQTLGRFNADFDQKAIQMERHFSLRKVVTGNKINFIIERQKISEEDDMVTVYLPKRNQTVGSDVLEVHTFPKDQLSMTLTLNNDQYGEKVKIFVNKILL